MENTEKIEAIPPTSSSTSSAPSAAGPTVVPPPAPHDWIFEIAESARKGENSLQNFISENPVRSVAIAVGLGYALNLIIKGISTRQDHL